MVHQYIQTISSALKERPATSGTTSCLTPRPTGRHLCSPLDIGQIADRLYVSESYLFRLFKKELHQTPQKYIREKRLMMAGKMLSEGERSTAVCTRCGFSDYTTFYRNYVGFFGCPPSEREKS